MDKNYIRKEALKDRKNCDSNTISKKVLDTIIEKKLLDKFKRIGIYYPIGNEINIMGLIDHYKDKEFYLPKTNEEIEFIHYKKGDLLIDGPFKTKEPKGESVNRDLIECFIIPCVAISKSNQRIGYGKGYYDRYLKDYNGYKIGICYSCFGDVDINCDSFDIYLDTKILG